MAEEQEKIADIFNTQIVGTGEIDSDVADLPGREQQRIYGGLYGTNAPDLRRAKLGSPDQYK